MILGLILTGVILGNISDYIENINEDQTRFERSFDELQVKLKQNKVTGDIQEMVQVFMNFCHQEQVEFNQPNKDFEYLSRDLRSEFLNQKYENLQKHVDIFSKIDKGDVFEMTSRFVTWIFLPGDVITKKGDLSKEMYYLRKGRVRRIEGDKKGEDTILEEGYTFNEYPFIFDSITLNTTIAEDFCIVDVLSKDSMNEILLKRPNLVAEIKSALKESKSSKNSNIVNSIAKMDFFVDFKENEIRYLFDKYLEVLYLRPGSLITSPSSKCNALYFIIMGKINRYGNTKKNEEFVKTKLMAQQEEDFEDEGHENLMECETFLEHNDIEERKKHLEDTTPERVLEIGDFMGSKFEIK